MTATLTPRQIKHMDDLLKLVQIACGKTGVDSEIKKLSERSNLDLFQRKRFTVGTYERFVKWCSDEYDVRNPIHEITPLEDGLFAINLSHSEITERDIFDEAAKEFEGKYLLFTWVGKENARVTWIELKPQSEGYAPPTFEAYRDGLVYYGIYYAYDDSLYLYGHKKASPMSRSLFFTKCGAHRRNLIGIVSGASYDKKVFASSCYAHALDEDKSPSGKKLSLRSRL